MLSNIASAEIPPLTETLLGWLQAGSADDLAGMGLDIAGVNDRTFVPRLVLGRYFESQFSKLVSEAGMTGNHVEVRTGCRVVDAANRPEGMELSVASPDGKTTRRLFDHVVLATGHQWPSSQQVRPGYFASPWPATTLAAVKPTAVGIRGTSLTAIDTAVAIALSHGNFVRREGALTYRPHHGTEAFSLTMMSRKGLLPEADFYFPLPHGPLKICTPAAIAAVMDRGPVGLLDAIFDLFKRELQAVDPAYVSSMRLLDATLEQFSEAYFERRARSDPFEWAAANLAESRTNHEARRTVGWRDAILRMHEVIAVIVPQLTGSDFQRFNRNLKPVFVDAYGAVPHESVERVLALRRAGTLGLLALGDDYSLDTHCAEGGARLVVGENSLHFPVFIEATGQRPLGAIQFPFLSLIEQGIIRDEACTDANESRRGIVIDDRFNPIASNLPADRLFCLSLPFIMGRHPFVQGITSSHEMGEIVGRHLACAVRRGPSAVDSLQHVA